MEHMQATAVHMHVPPSLYMYCLASWNHPNKGNQHPFCGKLGVGPHDGDPICPPPPPRGRLVLSCNLQLHPASTPCGRTGGGGYCAMI